MKWGRSHDNRGQKKGQGEESWGRDQISASSEGSDGDWEGKLEEGVRRVGLEYWIRGA